MAKTIEGKVAKILDEKTIVLNVGRAAGVEQGMVFCVYAPVDDVADPDTGESLGTWEAVKGYVQATHPQERLTVCRAFSPKPATSEDPKERGTHTLSSELVAVSMLSGGPLAQERLNVDKSQLAGMPEIGPISVGDLARSVDQSELTKT
jgi:hypothetical protein